MLSVESRMRLRKPQAWIGGIALVMNTAILQGQPQPSQPPASPPSIEQSPAPPPAPITPPRSRKLQKSAFVSAYGLSRSYLGVDICNVTQDRLGALKLKEERGVEITMVDKDGPAAKSGIKEHDVILDFNGTKVDSEEQLRRLLRETPPGRTISLGLSRDGQPLTIKVQLGDRDKLMGEMDKKWGLHIPAPPVMPDVPSMRDFAWAPDIRILRVSPTRIGIVVDNLTPQLGEYFGVKNADGVLVRSVEKGSAAEAGGIKAGDVITKIDNEPISDRSDLTRALRQKKSGQKIAVGIMRDRREQTLTVTLSENKESSSVFEFPVVDTQELKDALKNMRPEINRTVRIALNSAAAQLERQRICEQVSKSISQAMKQLEQQLHRIEFDEEF